MSSIHQQPRPEHPLPQFRRERWLNLNGVWSFELDPGASGVERNLPAARALPLDILVPFCPESELSGIGYPDFIESCWYQRTLSVPDAWRPCSVLLRFGGVDFDADIYIDGTYAGSHSGGSSPFALDITSMVRFGESQSLVVHVKDSIRSGLQPGGKQSLEFYSAGCFYTRVTGIWQTVWLEAVHPASLLDVHVLGDIDRGTLTFIPAFAAVLRDARFRVSVYDDDGLVGREETSMRQGAPLTVALPKRRIWSPESPNLYEVVYEVTDQAGNAFDRVYSYAGLREIAVEGDRLYLNGRHLYLRFVLDQGYYPDGIWTAPSDEALRRDIENGIACGFNGARLHQKAFEPRYHYWADRLGYLTWAESASWGMRLNQHEAARNFLSEWGALVRRDRNHPSVIGWSPLNETWDISAPAVHRRLHVDAYDITRMLDPTRPVNDASGGCHVCTDLYTVHIYEEDPDELYETLRPDADGKVFSTLGDQEAPYRGQPYIIAEFGGIRWLLERRGPFSIRSWGYGDSPSTSEEFYRRLSGQVNALRKLTHCAGFCYTQLTDVEQEENGLFSYDRIPKFDISRLREIFAPDGGDPRTDIDHRLRPLNGSSSSHSP